jgi:hypothetical protein
MVEQLAADAEFLDIGEQELKNVDSSVCDHDEQTLTRFKGILRRGASTATKRRPCWARCWMEPRPRENQRGKNLGASGWPNSQRGDPTTETLLRGTEGSNPLPSSDESGLVRPRRACFPNTASALGEGGAGRTRDASEQHGSDHTICIKRGRRRIGTEIRQLMYLVPQEDRLIITMQVRPEDINAVHPSRPRCA